MRRTRVPSPRREAARATLLAWACLAGWGLAPGCSIDGPEGAAGPTGGGPPPEPGPTEQCEATCAEDFPGGEGDYRSVRTCLLCDACATRCGAEAVGLCSDMASDACGEGEADCSSCIASTCASVQNADTTFSGECAGEADACAANPSCVSLNNCVSQCVNNSGEGGSGEGGSGGA